MKKDQIGDYKHVIPTLCFLLLAGVSAWFRIPEIVLPHYYLLFATPLCVLLLVIAFLAARSYARQRSRIFLLFGSGTLAFGVGRLLGSWGLVPYGENFAHTLYAIAAFLGGFYHLGGVALLILGPSAKRQPSWRDATLTCITVYLATTMVLLVVSLLTIKGLFPTFFVPPQAPTLVQQIVLTLAGVACVLSAALLVALHARTRMMFLSLYSNGLFLTALGIAIFLTQNNSTSLLNWAGSASRYVGSLYFVAAMVAGIRETRIHGSSLPDYLNELFRLHLDDQVNVRTKALVEMNKKLESSRLEMRNLAANLLHVREEERRKVAQEIHDELGQTLVALKMDLHWLTKHLRKDATSLRDKIKGTIELGEQAIGTVQRIASDLRPRMLDDLGLEPALDWLCANFMQRTKISCKMIADIPSGVIGRNAATALFRFTQEALANVGRHSHAHHATVRLFVSDGILNLQVEDDGVGITAQQAMAPQSYGQIGMRERVEDLGGSLSISGGSGLGTTLLARIPLPKQGGLA